MAHALDALSAVWGRFRSWRRTRPFWGGLLLVAAGVELLVAPAAQSLILPIDLIIYAGIAGVSGTLIGVLLIAIGVLSWLQPVQHTFFGLVGLLLALVSFVTSNFGGFVIGMLLGIVGASLVFAWAPRVRRRPRGRRRTRPLRGADTVTGDGDAEEDDGGEGGADGTVASGGTRPLAALALPLAFALTVTAVQAPTDWPWDWFFPPGDEEEQPSDAPSDGTSPTDGPSDTPSEDPSADPTAEPTDGDPDDPPEGPGDGGDPADPGAEDGAEDEERESEEDADPSDCPIVTGTTGEAETEEELLSAVRACQAAEEEGDLPDAVVDETYDCFSGATSTGGLNADRLTMSGARYDGVVECPTADGPRRYLRLSMSRADLRGAELWFEDAGTRMSLGLPTLTMEGSVEMHVTRMHVHILGIPLTFTPDFPPPLLLPYMIVTDVDVANPMASTDLMTIPGFDGRYSGA
ncbi:PT domain-containing protein [Nocardiopsis sp. EMB25]|uniref:DUF6114 domain-containing protein n=1 Tax=Nocardiopsis sp. EMB25 TaxID=2835867 RepID=UPI002284C09D|nr:DUF6114 domain-containing protein [Nocardiopsis sp. EMB25]MCY9782419.1 PT domain-containing protein [Nocardiopsis sp. EMB25]